MGDTLAADDIASVVVARAASGDLRALEQIVARYHDDMTRVCVVVCGGGRRSRRRRLLALRYVAGFDSTELGHVLKMSPSGVRSRLERLVARLRRELDDD